MGARLVAAGAVCGALAVLCAGIEAEPASAAPKPADVKVLTWNLYLGADVVPVIAALSTAPDEAPAIVKQVLENVRATNFPERAKKLAELIAAADPDVIALQECVLWRRADEADTLPPTNNVVPNATEEIYDFSDTLVKELKKRKRKYREVAITVGSDVEAPMFEDDLANFDDLRLTDRDVILVKKGVKVTSTQTRTFDTSLVLPVLGGVTVRRTYTVIDAIVRKKPVRIVAAHLESDSEPIRAAQAAELAAGPLVTPLPVVLLGDFNSDAGLAQPEATYTTLTGAGFFDVWTELHAGDPGLTWGQQPLLDNAESTATQRIDLILRRGAISPVSIELLGEVPADRIGSLWPSDHAGVTATLRLE